jgi:electron transfer flavoprotein beta subunit
MIAVLVSTRIDPISGRATRSPLDAAAVALAQTIDAEPLLIAAGEMPEAVAREYLALGIDAMQHIDSAYSGDAVAMLAQAASGAALILTGAQSQGGLGSGLLPYLLADALRRPLLADVMHIQAEGSAWLVRQALPRGARRRLRITTPAVLVLSGRAPAATRFSWDAAQRGRIVRVVPQHATPAPAATAWQFEPARKQLRPLSARVQQSGHSRMASAVGTAGPATAARLIKDGSVQDNAQALLDHLRAVGLVR